MKQFLLILISSVSLTGCGIFQAPPEIQVLRPVASSEMRQFQRKMVGIARSTTRAWAKSESARIKADHWWALARFAAASPKKFTPLYVRAQTAILITKLYEIDQSARDVDEALMRADVHLDRALKILEMFDDWMSTGLTKSDAESIKRFFEESSQKWIKAEKNKLIKDLEAKVSRLERTTEKIDANK